MSTFSQWQRAGRPVRRVTWVCGPEQVLADEVAGVQLSAAPFDVTRLTAGEVPDRDIWDRCALPGEGRLVLVRAADRLKDPARLVPLVRAARDVAMLVLVSGEDDLARDEDGLAPHLAAIRDSRYAQMVRCTAPKDDGLLDWTAGQWPGLGRNDAWRLASRAGGNLAAIRDAGVKAQASGLLEPRYIDVLCEPSPGAEMAELLVTGDKPAALAAARAMLPSAIGAALSLLGSRLSTLASIRDGQRRQLDTRAICSRLGVPQFLLARYRDVAVNYAPDRVRRCREILATADAAWRTGASGGVAETVIANW